MLPLKWKRELIMNNFNSNSKIFIMGTRKRWIGICFGIFLEKFNVSKTYLAWSAKNSKKIFNSITLKFAPPT